MALTDKQNEALATVVGWEKGKSGFWRRGFGTDAAQTQRERPDMATPEGAVELLDFCAEQNFRLFAQRSHKGQWRVMLSRWWDNGRGSGDTLCEAVAVAVYALYEGEYLAEKDTEGC